MFKKKGLIEPGPQSFTLDITYFHKKKLLTNSWTEEETGFNSIRANPRLPTS